MTSRPPPGEAPLREVRQLAASAANAEDAALLRLVRLLDDLPERGEADRVLEPVRERLQVLRPQRPLRFSRLLFLPLDGAIVAPTRWRRGGHEVPRTALQPLAQAVEAALGPTAAAIRREGEGHDMDDSGVVGALGGRLWPLAAEALPEAPPPGWETSGLGAEDYAAIRDVTMPVLAAGPAIHAAVRALAMEPSRAATGASLAAVLRGALAGPAAAGPRPLAAAVATLLRRAEAPGAVLQAAAEFGEQGRSLARGMADAAMAMLPDPSRAGLGAAAAAARRGFRAIEDLAASGLLDAERTRRLTAQRHAMDQTCRRLVAEAGTTRVAGALAALRQGGPTTDAVVAAIERDARAIRALAQAARGAGDPTAYDRTLRQIAMAVGELGKGALPAGGPTSVDLARVVEILDGPHAAMALLAEAGRD